MEKELVSVIIPCYNGENVIDRSIESIFNQTYEQIELIVVDDGSTDDSKSKIFRWIEKFKSKKWKLKYIYQENQGSGSAINTGLKYVNGEYLTLLDADDRLLEESILKRVEFLRNNQEYAIVRTNGWVVKGNSKWLFVQDEREKQENIFELIVLGKTNNWAGSYMIRSEELWKYYPNREIYKSRYGQNMQLMLPATYKSKCGFIDEPLMEYIQTQNSLTRSDDEKSADKDLENAKQYYNIRLHILKKIIKDQEELQKYITFSEASYLRTRMQIASKYKNKEDMKSLYVRLKEIRISDFNDKMEYYKLCHPKWYFIFRVRRKVKLYLHIMKNRLANKKRGKGIY